MNIRNALNILALIMLFQFFSPESGDFWFSKSKARHYGENLIFQDDHEKWLVAKNSSGGAIGFDGPKVELVLSAALAEKRYDRQHNATGIPPSTISVIKLETTGTSGAHKVRPDAELPFEPSRLQILTVVELEQIGIGVCGLLILTAWLAHEAARLLAICEISPEDELRLRESSSQS